MRQIDADELIKDFLNVCRTEFEIKNKCMADENVLFIIQNAPTIERQQGEWKCTFHSSFPQYEPDEYRCSICNGRGGKLDKFCKHCGAKMKDGAE